MRYAMGAAVVAMMMCSCIFAADAPATSSTDAAVEAKIQEGLSAYKAGKTGAAISALQDAISAMQKSQQSGLASYFPKTPEGFEAGKLDSQNIAVNSGEGKSTTASTMTQTFTRKSDGMEVTVALANVPEMVAAQKSIMENMKNPALLAAVNQDGTTTIKPFEESGWAGYRTIKKDDSAELMAFCNAYMITVRVNKCEPATLDQFWKAIDLKGLATATKTK